MEWYSDTLSKKELKEWRKQHKAEMPKKSLWMKFKERNANYEWLDFLASVCQFALFFLVLYGLSF